VKEIKVIKNSCQADYKEKGSRFIALAFPVQTVDEALTILERTRKKYYDASHHCYAYRLHNNKSKYSDAGEPSGTAGVRILNAIEHFSLSDIIVIIVRYFGGTKLGVGGLGRAYYDSAVQVLNKAKIINKKMYQKIFISTGHNLVQKIYHIFSSYESKILNVEYTDKARFECLVIPSDKQKIIFEINNAINGSMEISEGEKLYF
jgi:uncharacterized YigZ family protein